MKSSNRKGRLIAILAIIAVIVVGGILFQNARSSESEATPSRPNAPIGEIVFVTDRDGNAEIYLMNADGSNQRNLTNSPTSLEYSAAWRPVTP